MRTHRRISRFDGSRVAGPISRGSATVRDGLDEGAGGQLSIRLCRDSARPGVSGPRGKVDRVGDRNLPDLMVTNWLPSVGTPGARPMGNIPLLVRLVFNDGTELEVVVLWLCLRLGKGHGD